MTDGPARPVATPFRVGLVVGVTPDKWVRRWRQRRPHDPLDLVLLTEDEQLEAVLTGRVDMAFVREAHKPLGLHLIPLYEEVPVVVVGVEHPVAAYDEIPVADLTDEIRLDQDPTLSTSESVQTVAAGTGVVVLPLSVARAHHRKDVVAVPVGGLPTTAIGLAWRTDNDDVRVEAFIGIVRGRTEQSSRGPDPAPTGKGRPGGGRRPSPASRQGGPATRGRSPRRGRRG